MPFRPDFSLVIPCYNEERQLPLSIPPLAALLRARRLKFEVVLVVNGSKDGTGRAVDRLIARGLPVRRVDVPVNRGYGLGVRAGLKRARARHVCIMWADGQVAPRDVFRVLAAVRGAPPGVLAKVTRVRRDDGPVRVLISRVWNACFALAFGRISPDINGCPKVLHRTDLARLGLWSRDAFLEAELMIKAAHLGVRILEVPIRFRPRGAGFSHVRLIGYSTEFLRNILRFRFGSAMRRWRARHRRAEAASR